jgi:hypothetical protein
MKNIHVLPTDKTSRVFITKDEGLGFDNQMLENTELDCQNQNIYITSDEEIKEGDWFFRDGSIHKCFRVHRTDIEFLTSIDSVYCGSNTFWSKEFCQKIILTTDQDLIKDGVQAIDDTFLEWYVKNPSCEYVEARKIGNEWIYNADVPKEEPKQENCCTPIGQIKRYMNCVGCDRKPKQETLEQAYQRGYERGLNALIPLIENLNKEITELKRKGI